MRIAIVHPAIGHRRGEKYIRSWQMEPLPAAAIAGLTPADIDIVFFDDRMEAINYEQAIDAVVLSVETYTAKRAYQIATEFRKRNVPVIMGGFHATLQPDEVEKYAESIVVGEAETVWNEVIDDLRYGALKKRYQAIAKPALGHIKVNRNIFTGKRYLPIKLIETGRGCKFPCEFCAIQAFFDRTHRARPVDDIIKEIKTLQGRAKIFFFVDDNFIADIQAAKELLRELVKLNIRWITQLSINAAHDEEFLSLLSKSGCRGVLIGFESLDEGNLKIMRKSFNTMNGGYSVALKNLRRFNIPIYATFVFGFDHDTRQSFEQAVSFAIEQRFFISAFNHLTPFPGTPLYQKLDQSGDLRFQAWWLDDDYRYNDVPFFPKQLKPEEVTQLCVQARKKFYSWSSIIKRGMDKTNRSNAFMFRNYFPINWMHRADVNNRNGYPLGDENWRGELLEAVR